MMEGIQKEYIFSLIENGDTERCISTCLDRVKLLMTYYTETSFSTHYKVLLLLSSQVKNLKQNKIIGIVDGPDYQSELNKITSNLIDWINDVEDVFWTQIQKHSIDEEIPELEDYIYKPKSFFFKKVKIYRFRAECNHDVEELMKLIGKNIMSITRTRGALPDTYVEFSTSLSLAQIRNAMRKVVDGHVMLQTVALKEDYTGERDYDLH